MLRAMLQLLLTDSTDAPGRLTPNLADGTGQLLARKVGALDLTVHAESATKRGYLPVHAVRTCYTCYTCLYMRIHA